MEYYKLQWFNLSLLVACEKCGIKIPFQSTKGNPSCTNCGAIAKLTWEHIMKYCEIEALKKGEPLQSTIIGQVQATIAAQAVAEIHCFSCHKSVEWTESSQVANSCPHCGTGLEFFQWNSFKDLIFYVQTKIKRENPTNYIAVRCAACGAGVRTNPNDIHYHCESCGVDNVLPMALRAKTELNEVYVGVKQEVFPPALLDKTNSSDKARRVLHLHRRENFTDEQLVSALLRFPGNFTIFTMIKDGYRFEIPTQVYESLWQKSSHIEICRVSGKALGKPEDEISAKLKRLNPTYTPAKQMASVNNSGFFASKGLIWIYVLLIVLMLLCIVFYYLFKH